MLDWSIKCNTICIVLLSTPLPLLPHKLELYFCVNGKIYNFFVYKQIIMFIVKGFLKIDAFLLFALATLE